MFSKVIACKKCKYFEYKPMEFYCKHTSSIFYDYNYITGEKFKKYCTCDYMRKRYLCGHDACLYKSRKKSR